MNRRTSEAKRSMDQSEPAETAEQATPEPQLEVVDQAYRAQKIPTSRVRLAEQVRNCWRVAFLPGTTRDDLLDPKYWSHVAALIKQGDIIDGITDDCKCYIRAIVTSSGYQFATVHIMDFISLESVAVQSNEAIPYAAEYNGLSDKWRIRRLADNQIMRAGFETEKLAERWIDSHMMALKR